MDQLPRLGKRELRIGDYMSFIRPFFEDQNTVVRLPALLKYRLGNKLMSYEEIDVRIFI